MGTLKRKKMESEPLDFEINGIKYTTLRGNFDCKECAFFLNTCDPLPRPRCAWRERKDKTNVIFKLKSDVDKEANSSV